MRCARSLSPVTTAPPSPDVMFLMPSKLKQMISPLAPIFLFFSIFFERYFPKNLQYH